MKHRLSDEQRFDFIHTLRGVAPLLVLWSHLVAWWPFVAAKSTPLFTGWDAFCRAFRLYQHGGHLGVLLFFLVSGFVITHVSLRETAFEFAAKRILRLYPTLCLAVFSLPVLAVASSALGLPAVFGSESPSWIRGLLFLSFVQGTPHPLTVLWTLFVEGIFYFLTCALIGVSRRTPAGATWIMLGVVHLACLASKAWPPLSHSMGCAMYVPFLLIGRVAYFARSNTLPAQRSVPLALACYLSFLLVFENITPGKLFSAPTEPILTHIYALLIFAIASLAQNHRTGRFLSFCADISYPLYLFHVPWGGFVLFALSKAGWPYEAALPVAVICVVMVSWVVNRYIEVPSQDLGRRMFRRAVRPIEAALRPTSK